MNEKKTPTSNSINTGGGTYIEEGVNTGGGDFIAGDKNIYLGICPPEKQPIIVPPLPRNFLERPDILSRLCDLVLHRNNSQSLNMTALHGMGGVGKSVLGQALCYDKEIQQAFSGGIIWVSVGKDFSNNLVDQMKTIGVALGDSLFYYTSPEASITRLRTILADKSVLIVLDDVWEGKHIRQFRFDANQCHIVFTTRDKNVVQAVEANSLWLDILNPDEALRLLKDISKSDAPELAEISKLLGYLPLALRLAGKKLTEEGITANSWLNQYREHISKLSLDSSIKNPERNDSLNACFKLSTDRLSDKKRLLYHLLGIFPEDVLLEKKLILDFWKAIEPDYSEFEFNDLINSLGRLALIKVTDNAISLHDLLHDYNKQILGSKLPEYQDAFLLHRNPENRPWHEIEKDDYIFQHLAHHMVGAHREDELYKILSSTTIWMDDTLKQPDPFLDTLVINIWLSLWERDAGAAKDYLKQVWLPRKTKNKKQGGYFARTLAVRCAFEVAHDDGLAIALSHPDQRIRSVAMTYTYYLSQQKSENETSKGIYRALNILELVSENTTRYGFIPDIKSLRTIFLLAPLIIVDQYQGDNQDNVVIKDVANLLVNSIETLSSKSFLRIIGTATRNAAIRVSVKMFTGLLKRAESSSTSINGFSGVKLYFDHSEETKKQVCESLIYFDRRILFASKVLPDEISNSLFRLYEAGDRISILIAEFILISYGFHNPDGVENFTNKLLEKYDDPDCVNLFSIVAVWYSILGRLPKSEIKLSHMKTLKKLVTKWMNTPDKKYGKVAYRNKVYQVYPLGYYGSMWTKVYPGTQVDLLKEYTDIALETNNLALQLHIIGTFHDYRHIFYDYNSVLPILNPFIQIASTQTKTPTNEELRAEIIRSLGSLHGIRPAPVDVYLNEINAPMELIHDIHSYSWQKPSTELYLRFYQFLSDIIIYAPTEFIQKVINLLDKALSADSIGEMATIIFNELILLTKGHE